MGINTVILVDGTGKPIISCRVTFIDSFGSFFETQTDDCGMVCLHHEFKIKVAIVAEGFCVDCVSIPFPHIISLQKATYFL
jgi:hypothetical protein